LIILDDSRLAIHDDGEAHHDKDQPARIDQPEPGHELLPGDDLVVDMVGAVDQVGSGVLKAVARQFKLIVWRQFAVLPKHPTSETTLTESTPATFQK
jgi:hypothetical protein